MTGYSGTPLPQKLGIKIGFRAYFVDPPADVLELLKTSLKQCELVRHKKLPLDFAMLFATARVKVEEEFGSLAAILAPAGMVWVSWPKKSSGVKSDLDENVIRKIGLRMGLVDVKVCAVTEIWSGLKFVRRVKDR